MDYEKLLNGFEKLPILFRPTIFMLTAYPIFDEETITHDNIRFLIKTIGEDYYNQDSVYIVITKNGLELDISKLKKKLMKYFNIENEKDIIKSLNDMKDIINKNDEINYSDISPKVEESYNNFLKSKTDEYNYRKKYLHKKSEIDFETLYKRIIEFEKEGYKNLVKNQIETFKKLCLNEKKYTKVKDIFDQDRVNLYLAQEIMLKYAESCQKRGNDKGYKSAINYLKQYLNNNSGLLENDFKVPSGYNNVDPYSITCVKDRVKSLEFEHKRKHMKANEIVKNNKPVEDKNTQFKVPIEQFDYSFFESSSKDLKKILEKATKLSKKRNDPEHLQEILKRKIELYSKLDYISIKIGKDSFDGYIGFELEEGYVVLDKLFENMKNFQIANGNAIYIIKDEDFERVTTMSRPEAKELIESGDIKGERIEHKGCYEERFDKAIKKLIK